MHPESRTSTPAGWYQSPGEAFVDRYWDGSGWTEASRPRPSGVSTTAGPVGDDGRVAPVRVSQWVALGLGTVLLVAAPFVPWPGHHVSALLGPGGALVLGVSGTLLRHDLDARRYAAVCVVLGAVIAIASAVAALLKDPLGWIAAAAGLVLVVVGVIRLRRGRASRSIG